jgi:3-hydroxy-9,10-secoandrosta-1,3,5(10)-triene-9,17-dione monooxygenase reductase component
VDCEVEAAHPAGDHTIFVGRVVACGVRAAEGRPLVYHNTAYTALSG